MVLVKKEVETSTKIIAEGSMCVGDVTVETKAVGADNANRYDVKIKTGQTMIVDGKDTNELHFSVFGDWEMSDICECFADIYEKLVYYNKEEKESEPTSQWEIDNAKEKPSDERTEIKPVKYPNLVVLLAQICNTICLRCKTETGVCDKLDKMRLEIQQLIHESNLKAIERDRAEIFKHIEDGIQEWQADKVDLFGKIRRRIEGRHTKA